MLASLSLAFLSAYVLSPVFALRRPSQASPEHFKPDNIITRDVAIVGGGSSGTYSAISLKDDGKSVIVIEKKGRIGGHTETYIDPTTGIPVDIGVLIFHNISVVRDYFERFDVPLITYGSDVPPDAPPISAVAYDFRTGEQVNVSTPTQAEFVDALGRYIEQLQKYPLLDEGMFLPDPVPEDLILPFGKFVEKYHLEAILPTLYSYNPGLGDVLTVPTVEQMRVFGLSVVQQFSTGFLTTAHHNNSEIYTKAEKELLSTSSLLLSSAVVHTERDDSGIKLIVQTPGGRKLVCAKKLIITIPAKLDFLKPFDLSTQEEEVFARFVNAGYYTTILNNTGLPENIQFINAAQNSPYNLPTLPAAYNIVSSGPPGLHSVYYGTPLTNLTFPVSDDEVKSDIIDTIKTLQKAHPDKFNETEPYFVEYSSHAPFYLQARPEDTKNGFYDQLYALQGLRNTYWNGASFRAQDSSDIWRYTKSEILPKVLEGL